MIFDCNFYFYFFWFCLQGQVIGAVLLYHLLTVSDFWFFSVAKILISSFLSGRPYSMVLMSHH